MRNWLMCLILSCAAAAASAEEFAAKVIVVIDGDTVMILRDCKNTGPEDSGAKRHSSCGKIRPEKIRLAEIDAPEKAQPGGMESKQALADLVLKNKVNVKVQAVDKYGRLVAHLALNGKNVNEDLVRRGMAWEYSNFHSNKTYIALQGEAQQARRGLWAQDNPMPPWQWRKQHEADAPAQAQTATAPAADFACGSKHTCSQMRTCEEAKFYLTRCGVKSLDRNGDGVPCEKLCIGRE